MTKRCSRCRETLHMERFYKHKKKKDGRASYCKTCHIAYEKELNHIRMNRIGADGYPVNTSFTYEGNIDPLKYRYPK